MRSLQTVLFLLPTLLAASALPAQAPAAVDRVSADLRYLAADEREGRGVGTEGLDAAATYLAERLAAIGLEPGGTEGYFQPFAIDPTAPAVAHAGIEAADVKNVVGVIPGTGALATQAVVLGAHYDHLGLGGMGSMEPDSAGVVHNGADDNASGTAALLEAARLLAGRDAPARRTMIFVAFTAEELGLIGSSHYADHPVAPHDSTIAMINFDMVGRLRSDTLLAIGMGSAEELPALLDSVNAAHGFVLLRSDDPYGRSDHSTFYTRGVPATHFFTNVHEDYHRTTDDWQRINSAGITRIAGLAADLAFALAVRPERLTFVQVEQPQTAMRGGGYGAWLGTIPDMTSTPGGVRLTGVRAGSPADEAGMQAGDILVRLGEFEIADLYAMTDALRAHKPGDTVTLVVVRDGERVELTATLGERGG